MSVVTRIRTSQELTVPFTPEEVWAVLADVAAYPEWWPARLRVEILHHQGELLGAEFEVRPLPGRMFRIRFEEIESPASMRLRFFGGSLEGPGGFHLLALEGATQVRYEMDVFARGLDVALMSMVLPLERIHRSRMRAVLQSLSGRLTALRKAAERGAPQSLRLLDREGAVRQAEEEAAARRVAEEQARRRTEEAFDDRRIEAATESRRAEEEAAARAAAEEAERRAVEDALARRAAEEEAGKRALEEASVLAANEAAQREAADKEDARRAAEEESRRAEAEAAALAAAEAARRLAVEEEAARREAEEAESRRVEEEGLARSAAEAEKGRAAQEEAARVAAEAAARRRAEDEGAARAAAEESKRRAAEEEAARLAAEEAERRAAKEEAALRAAEAARQLAEEQAAARAAEEEVERRAAREGSGLRPLWSRVANWLTEPAGARSTASAPSVEPAPQSAPSPTTSNLDIAQRYLDALSSRAAPEEIGRYLAPDVMDEEFPHRFLGAAVTRGFSGLLEARTGALVRFSSERYELGGVTGGGSQVAMEVRWKGSVTTTGEGFTEGHELDARIAFFLKFADGRIVRQRRYACFEPWSTRTERGLILDERVAQAGQAAKAPFRRSGDAPIDPGDTNFEIARRYIAALEARADAEMIARFYAPDAVHDEFPNRLAPGGAHRDLQAIKLARSSGLALLASEAYEMLGATGSGSQVAIEVSWRGVVGEGMGLFTAGEELEARLGIFLEFRDGLIVGQRNYTCAPLRMLED